MNPLPKTKRGRLALVIGATVVLVAAGAGLYAHRASRQGAELARLLERGRAALEDGRPRAALARLERYVERRPSDPAGLVALGRARAAVPQPNGAHLERAKRILRRALNQDPDQRAATRHLIDLSLRTGQNERAARLAKHLLESGPEDPEVIANRARALYRQVEYVRALPLLRRHNELEPLNVGVQLLTLATLKNLDRPDEQILAHADRLLRRAGREPACLLIAAVAQHIAGNNDRALNRAEEAARGDPPSADFVQRLVSLFDNAGRFDQARKVLAKGAEQLDAPVVRAMYARRLWQAGEWEAVVRHTPGERSAVSGRPDVRLPRLELRGLRAFALLELGETRPAEAIAEELEAADGPAPAAWAAVLRSHRALGGASSRELASACREALSHYPDHPVLAYYVGEARSSLGERALAVAAWKDAAESAPAWAAPRTRLAAAELARGRHEQAFRYAQSASRRAGARGELMLILAHVLHARLRAGHEVSPEKLGVFLDRLGGGGEGTNPRLLAISIDLTARDEGTEAARAALKRELESDRRVPPGVLLTLARVSRLHDLGHAEACLDRYEKRYGRSPALATARARRLARNGEIDAALALFDPPETATAPEARIGWLAARARFLQAHRPRRAVRAWIELADRFPENRRAQYLALRRNATWRNRAFARRAISRLEELGESESLAWRRARARFLIRHVDTESSAKRALGLLRPIVRKVDRLPGAHELAARALVRMGRAKRALAHLERVREASDRPLELRLAGARLAWRAGEGATARDALEAVLASDEATRGQKRRAVGLLYQQGALERARAALVELHGGEPVAADPLLARLHMRLGETQKALAVAEKLLESPSLDRIDLAVRIRIAAGRREGAAAAIEKLETVEAPASAVELVRASYHERLGEREEAIAAYERAVEAAPASPRPWLRRIAFALEEGDLDRTRALIERAAEPVDGHPAIRTLAEEPELLEPVERTPALRSLVRALLNRPSYRREAAEALRLFREAPGDKRVARLQKLSDREPRFYALRMLICRLRLARGEPERAAQMARRIAKRFPNRARPAWLAARALAEANRWTEALSMAKRWRRLSFTNPVPAELMIARAEMQLGRPRRALQWTKRRIERVQGNPSEHAGLLERHARALLASGRPEKARQLLEPLIERGARWRRAFAQLAAFGLRDAERAASWLRRAEDATPPEARDERMSLARLFYTLGERADDPALRDHAIGMIEGLVERGLTSAAVWANLGTLRLQAEQREKAADAFRRALEADPEHAMACNNLAMILVEKGENLERALELARIVHRKRPKSPEVIDTLALVQLKLGRPAEAAARWREALELAPDRPAWRLSLVEALLEQGKRGEAERQLTYVKAENDTSAFDARTRERLEKLERRIAES